MKKIVSIVLAFLILAGLVVSTMMSAFAVEETSSDYDWDKLRDQNITLNVFNWGEYISNGEDDSMDVNKAFTEKTGIKVNYQMFATNEEMYTKIKSGGGEYDILIPSDYMIGKMANEDMLEELDFSQIPNFKYIDTTFTHGAFDPENKYYVPYTWGVVGIIYNTTMVDEPVTSWDMLWNEKYAGNILMFNNSRDAIALALLKEGKSLNPSSVEDIQIAKEELIKQKPVVQAYVADEIFDKMGGGEAAMAPYYSGDGYTMIQDNPDLAFAIPEEGTNYFVDGAVIPKNAANIEAAHMYINFLCETEVALANAEYICYSSPQVEAVKLLDDEMRNNPMIYPSAEILAKTEAFSVLSEELNAELDTAWSEVKAYSEKSNETFMPILLLVAVIALVVIIVLRSKKKKKLDY